MFIEGCENAIFCEVDVWLHESVCFVNEWLCWHSMSVVVRLMEVILMKESSLNVLQLSKLFKQSYRTL